jgi:hypothetical protein
MARLGLVAVLSLALLGCGGRAGPGGPAEDDAGAPADAAVDGRGDGGVRVDAGLPPLCSGDFPRMVANGIESNPAVTGFALPLNCCDAAEFQVVTATVPAELVPIVVTWRAQVGVAVEVPATIDLANPPEGWAVRVDVGCDPNQTYCVAPDSYTDGFTGTLQVARAAAGAYEMTLCLAVAEPGGSPHPLLHSLVLYAPRVAASY